ncbi:hypothetical protein ACFYW8_15035 [Streptomyces sp. NPDC002742]|jgi:hypothetical protein|uniref:hypothetical protein n=1 Tax=unclassified Streptomyces TaxID=2593676 RepID=UPI00342BD9DA
MSTALANTRSRPVELHLSSGVVVVGPLGQVPCDAEDLDLGQVRFLCRTGVLVAHTLAGKPARRPRKRD